MLVFTLMDMIEWCGAAFAWGAAAGYALCAWIRKDWNPTAGRGGGIPADLTGSRGVRPPPERGSL